MQSKSLTALHMSQKQTQTQLAGLVPGLVEVASGSMLQTSELSSRYHVEERIRDALLASLLHLCGEGNTVAVLPHFCDKCFTRDNGGREADGTRLEL